MEDIILDVKNLKVAFKTEFGEKEVIKGINFCVKKGETVAIVGESGSGKSVTNLSILGLNNSACVTGEVIFGGENLLNLSEKRLQTVRGNKIAMIFQDPMTALNPFLKIIDQIMEPLVLHKKMSRKAAKLRAIELLKMVGIKEVEKHLGTYPHHFSGGMRQRVMIAIALACEPEILIADEPTTALDVTIQAQILKLIEELGKKLGMSVILITHNLGIVAGFADRVLVMHHGEIVEEGSVDKIFYNTQHPYTRGLIRSIPRLDQDKNERLHCMVDNFKDEDDKLFLLKGSTSRSMFKQAWSKAQKNRLFIIGLSFLGLYLLVVSLVNFLPLHSYVEQYSIHRNLKPSFRRVKDRIKDSIIDRERTSLVSLAKRQKRNLTIEEQETIKNMEIEVNENPIHQRRYIFGTDSLGRDLLSRLVYASRISIFVGILGSMISVSIGVFIGTTSAYIGGRFDRFIMSAMEVLYSMPYTLLIIILMSVFGNNIMNIFLAVALLSWLVEARLVRGQVLSLKNCEFIEAARSMGAGTGDIIVRHIIPNILDIVIVFATVRVPTFILAESFLSFLGLGIAAPMASWGGLIQDGVRTMELYPWQLFLPALIMAIFLFAINFVGDGLRDCFDLKERTQGSGL